MARIATVRVPAHLGGEYLRHNCSFRATFSSSTMLGIALRSCGRQLARQTLTRAGAVASTHALVGHVAPVAVLASRGSLVWRRANHINTTTAGASVPADVAALTDAEYNTHATHALDTINDELDAFFERQRIFEADVDEEAGVMEINVSEGTYVINKQPPTKQIWLSSPISGPRRFDFHNGKWVSLRDNIHLRQLLKDEINGLYGGFDWEGNF